VGSSACAPPTPISAATEQQQHDNNTGGIFGQRRLAQGVAEGAKEVPGANVVIKNVGEVSTDDLLAANALIVGSPVYYTNMAGEVKTFFDNWLLKHKFPFAEFKMRNKVGAEFVTGGAISNGKESVRVNSETSGLHVRADRL
jgi:NAD(P)H dehydrogenase (quinone)